MRKYFKLKMIKEIFIPKILNNRNLQTNNYKHKSKEVKYV